MSNFGQEVVMTITDESGTNVKLEVGGGKSLRIDFDVRLLDGFGRASVTAYNLNEETIGSLIGGGQKNFLSLRTRLHGGPWFHVMDKYFISNSIDEKKLPDTITTMYCYDYLKLKVLDKQIDVSVDKPSLEAMMDQIRDATGFKGKITYQSFPNGLKEMIPPKPKAKLIGSVEQIMQELQKEYPFHYYTKPNEILLVCKPTLKQTPDTLLDELAAYTLNTNNMRANPRLAPAQLEVTSNLDGNIQPGTVLDITKLLTAGSSQDLAALEIAAEFARKATVGYNRYQTLAVQHKGSNFTDLWHTMATAIAPKKGNTMPTVTWFR